MLLIVHIVTISAITIGTYFAVQEWMHTFGVDPDEYWTDLPTWGRFISKPIWYCPTCMCSIHGTIWHFYLGGEVWSWIPTVLGVCLVNVLIVRIANR